MLSPSYSVSHNGKSVKLIEGCQASIHHDGLSVICTLCENENATLAVGETNCAGLTQSWFSLALLCLTWLDTHGWKQTILDIRTF